ncbi:MAG: DUF92 domain-containing protein [Chloroflexia bacterium]
MLLRLACGLLLSLGIAIPAGRLGSLSTGGVLGAVLVGTLTLGCGGWPWGLALVAFFVSSSLLTRWQEERKRPLAALQAKGGKRDLGQVLANGGLGALLAVLAALFPHPVWPAAFVGALAVATADTWATEVGALSPRPPRLLTTGRPVAVGTSGGVTAWGLGAAAGGALFIGAVFCLAGLAEGAWVWAALPWALAGGLAGSTGDSLLGATLQGLYRCVSCGKETERREHCGRPTVPVRGLPWLANDGVNFLATAFGALVAGGLSLVL